MAASYLCQDCRPDDHHRRAARAHMRCVVFSGTGGNEIVSVQLRPDPEPGKFEALIATEYAAVNPADVLQREGRHPPPGGSPSDIPGLEVAGKVIALDEAVTGFEVGDACSGWSGRRAGRSGPRQRARAGVRSG